MCKKWILTNVPNQNLQSELNEMVKNDWKSIKKIVINQLQNKVGPRKNTKFQYPDISPTKCGYFHNINRALKKVIKVIEYGPCFEMSTWQCYNINIDSTFFPPTSPALCYCAVNSGQ